MIPLLSSSHPQPGPQRGDAAAVWKAGKPPSTESSKKAGGAKAADSKTSRMHPGNPKRGSAAQTRFTPQTSAETGASQQARLSSSTVVNVKIGIQGRLEQDELKTLEAMVLKALKAHSKKRTGKALTQSLTGPQKQHIAAYLKGIQEGQSFKGKRKEDQAPYHNLVGYYHIFEPLQAHEEIKTLIKQLSPESLRSIAEGKPDALAYAMTENYNAMVLAPGKSQSPFTPSTGPEKAETTKPSVREGFTPRKPHVARKSVLEVPAIGIDIPEGSPTNLTPKRSFSSRIIKWLLPQPKPPLTLESLQKEVAAHVAARINGSKKQGLTAQQQANFEKLFKVLIEGYEGKDPIKGQQSSASLFSPPSFPGYKRVFGEEAYLPELQKAFSAKALKNPVTVRVLTQFLNNPVEGKEYTPVTDCFPAFCTDPYEKAEEAWKARYSDQMLKQELSRNRSTP